MPRWQRDERQSSAGRELVVDKLLLAVVIGLVLFGTIMVYSASAVLAQKQHDGNQFYYLFRQGGWVVIGLIAMLFGLSFDYRRYNHRNLILVALAVTAILLCAVFLFPKVNGSHRWIRFGFLSLQPSELSKLALIAYLGHFFEKQARDMESFKQTFLPAALVSGAFIVLVGGESDFGTALMLSVIFIAMAYQAGIRLLHLFGIGALAVPAAVCMVLFVDWRLQRVLDFLDPWKNQSTSSYQVVQSMIAFGSGGTDGVGFAQSKQKLFFLPAAHTDFIFSVIGEELGLVGTITLLTLFAIIAWRGFRAARYAPDLFGQLLAVGITVMLTAQACFNMSVTLSLVPNKGIPLPFISSGGSSLAISMFAAGVLLNVSKHAKAER